MPKIIVFNKQIKLIEKDYAYGEQSWYSIIGKNKIQVNPNPIIEKDKQLIPKSVNPSPLEIKNRAKCSVLFISFLYLNIFF